MGILRTVCFCCLLLLCICLIGCCINKSKSSAQGGNIPPLNSYIQKLCNDDLRWEGTFVGLLVGAHGRSAEPFERIKTYREAAIVPLIDAMKNDDQFAIAHVLLCFIVLQSGIDLQDFDRQLDFEPREGYWHGLRVRLRDNPCVTYDIHDKQVLYGKWQAWGRSQGLPLDGGVRLQAPKKK